MLSYLYKIFIYYLQQDGAEGTIDFINEEAEI